MNQIVIDSNKYAVVVAVLLIILIGIFFMLFNISRKINK